MADSKIITHVYKNIETKLEREGFTKNSPDYNKKLVEEKISMCQNMRGLNSCGQCNYSDFCTLLSQYYMTEKY